MTKHMDRLAVLFSGAALLVFCGCQTVSTTQHHEHPSQLEQIPGLDVARVSLTQKAIERIDLQTARVAESKHSPAMKSVPYSALLYDAHGDTWVYTNPKPRTFVRQQVIVDRIEGDDVLLAEGPDIGTQVATVGVAELYGTEFEVGH